MKAQAERLAELPPRCGAQTRLHGVCRKFPMKGKRRCKLHGGASTGPRTAAGRARIAAAHLKHGRYTKEERLRRREFRELVQAWRDLRFQIREK
jgi:hypothetical protein